MEHIAVLRDDSALCMPILLIYCFLLCAAPVLWTAPVSFAFRTSSFLYTTYPVLGQYTVPTIGPAFRNTVVFTAIA